MRSPEQGLLMGTTVRLLENVNEVFVFRRLLAPLLYDVCACFVLFHGDEVGIDGFPKVVRSVEIMSLQKGLMLQEESADVAVDVECLTILFRGECGLIQGCEDGG